jgi:hypothetical protein
MNEAVTILALPLVVVGIAAGTVIWWTASWIYEGVQFIRTANR